MLKKIFWSVILVGQFLIVSPGRCETSFMSSEEIDRLVLKVMDDFQVPGATIGIIKDGKVIHLKGYGVRQAGKSGKVDEKTLFAIASNSKAFTAAALALLVDEGKVAWEDKVIDYLPNFRMSDPWVTREFTLRDLLVHNSGLGMGAGDLMFVPTPGFTRKEMIENLRFLEPVSSFRTEYAYSNLMYVVAGEVVSAASGMSYEEFIDEKILKPLRMDHCVADKTQLAGVKNIAEPHAVVDGKLGLVERLQKIEEPVVVAAAGGIQCSGRSMLRWVGMLLNEGKTLEGEPFLSERNRDELWKPVTVLPVNPAEKKWYNTHFSLYGLGWFLGDMQGYKWVSHAGALPGMVSYVSMLPELNLGVVVLTNQQSGVARNALMAALTTGYLDYPHKDWAAEMKAYYKPYFDQAEQELKKANEKASQFSGADLDVSDYQGRFHDNWFGDVIIERTEEGLYFKSLKSERLKGRLNLVRPDVFIASWEDRSLSADAYVLFTRDFEGEITGMKLKAVSPMTDFSFDFHDLDFVRQK